MRRFWLRARDLPASLRLFSPGLIFISFASLKSSRYSPILFVPGQAFPTDSIGGIWVNPFTANSRKGPLQTFRGGNSDMYALG